jgi:hypothetical protein
LRIWIKQYLTKLRNLNDEKWKPWNNFHDSKFKRSNMIRRLYKKLNDSPYKGAYMTDIVKCVPTTDETCLKQTNKKGKVNMDAQMGLFIDEPLNLTVSNHSIELYLLGDAANDIFNNYLKRNDKYHLLQNKILFSGHTYHQNRHCTDDEFYQSITQYEHQRSSTNNSNNAKPTALLIKNPSAENPVHAEQKPDCLRRVRPLAAVLRVCTLKSNTLPKQPYPDRSAAGLIDLTVNWESSENDKGMKTWYIKQSTI